MKFIKLIIITLLLSLNFGFLVTQNTYAEDLTITVTEEVPWGNCVPAEKDEQWKIKTYNCTIEKWFWSVMAVFNKMLKYATLIAALWGVLFIVINWIAISASWVDSGAKEAAKGRITKTLLWLLVLLLSGTILNIVAPWVFK